ncbi:hypothetical protein TIFTF001_044471 [Ficus carica]|uniref:Uncharacterized protein n=1 Tax=Ficus carica TaxID=3494 RepID=A0AA88CU50_FICCA|nr:hypothetical protein TIFTF001_044458 [Ficus carica]GMN30394.1 hypothetical protein TIFTF001_044471 [Ficus carica]
MAAEEGPTSQGPEEGEVTRGIHVAENMVVLDEPEVGDDQSGDHQSRGVCKVRCGSCSGTSPGRCPVLGPYSVVREPTEFSVQGPIVGPAWALLLVNAQSWDLTPQSGDQCLQGQIVGLARAPLLVGAQSWDLTPQSGNQRKFSVCEGRFCGSCSGTSNIGRRPVVGLCSAVQGPTELVSARAEWILFGHVQY